MPRPVRNVLIHRRTKARDARNGVISAKELRIRCRLVVESFAEEVTLRIHLSGTHTRDDCEKPNTHSKKLGPDLAVGPQV